MAQTYYTLTLWHSLRAGGDISPERYATLKAAKSAAYAALDSGDLEGVTISKETIYVRDAKTDISSSAPVCKIHTVVGPYDDEFGGVEYYTPHAAAMSTQTATIHRLQAAYRKYRSLDAAVDAIGDEADRLIEAGDLAAADALDAEWDEAYRACNAALTAVADLIVDLIHVDRNTARIMIHRYPERLERLMSATVVDAGKEA